MDENATYGRSAGASGANPGQALPSEPLREVFTPSVLQRLDSIKSKSKYLKERLNVVRASGSYIKTNEDFETNRTLGALRAKRAAWDVYLTAAYVCGLMDGESGRDLLGRLRDSDDHNFFGAIAECMACWFLSGKLGLVVSPRPPGRKKKELDMQIHTSNEYISVEVKSAFVELHDDPEDIWESGDASDALAGHLSAANKQFRDDVPNVLILVSEAAVSFHVDRRIIIGALIGKPVIKFEIDTSTGAGTGKSWSEFMPDGHLVRRKDEKGRNVTPEGHPKFRRIGAILTLEESRVYRDWRPEYDTEYQQYIEPRALIAHNPYAYHKVSQDLWKAYPQLIPLGEKMVWSDETAERESSSPMIDWNSPAINELDAFSQAVPTAMTDGTIDHEISESTQNTSAAIVDALRQSLGKSELLIPESCEEWALKFGIERISDPETIHEMSLDEVRRVMTAHIQMSSHNPGQLVVLFNLGVLGALLRRLMVLRDIETGQV